MAYGIVSTVYHRTVLTALCMVEISHRFRFTLKQTRIDTLRGEQLVVGANFRHPPLFKHVDPVSKAQGRFAMGSNDHGALSGQLAQDLRHSLFSLSIERRTDLIKRQNRRIGSQRAPMQSIGTGHPIRSCRHDQLEFASRPANAQLSDQDQSGPLRA